MDPRGFCSSTRLFIVAGKGGVGKTTVTAALARLASSVGLRTLIVEVEGRNGLAAAFGIEGGFGYDQVELARANGDAAAVRARTITPEDALLEWLDDHGMRRVSRRLVKTGAVDVVATAAPGIKDILVLGKVKQLERLDRGAPNAPDLIVLDAPAAGHAVSFLQSAHGLLDAVRVGPIRTQAHEAVELLQDPARCQVILVTLPEETPVNELIETAYQLEDRVGVQLAPVVVNSLYPPAPDLATDPAAAADAAGVALTPEEATGLRDAADFRLQRQQLQDEQVRRLADALPLPQLHLPYLFSASIGPPERDVLARALRQQVERLPEALRIA